MRTFGLALTALIAACNSAATPHYLGSPYASIHGFVSARTEVPLPEIDMLLIWTAQDSDTTELDWNSAYSAAHIQLATQFPASFELTLYEPPPPAAQQATAIGGPNWVGQIVAVERQGLNELGRVDKSLVLATVSDCRLLFDAPKGVAGESSQPRYRLMQRQRSYCLRSLDYICVDRERPVILAAAEGEYRRCFSFAKRDYDLCRFVRDEDFCRQQHLLKQLSCGPQPSAYAEPVDTAVRRLCGEERDETILVETPLNTPIHIDLYAPGLSPPKLSYPNVSCQE